MYESETCELCYGEIQSNSIFLTPEGSMCEDCFVGWAQKQLSEEEWDEKYQGSAEKLADLMDIEHQSLEQFLEDKRNLAEEVKYDSWNDR